MKFQAKPTNVTNIETDLLAVFAYASKKEDTKGWEKVLLTSQAKDVDQALVRELSELAQAEGYDAEFGKIFFMHAHGKISAKRIALVGLGKLEELDMNRLQVLAATIGRKATSSGVQSVALAIPEEIFTLFPISDGAQGFVEGMLLGTYTFLKHKHKESQDSDKQIKDVVLLTPPGRLNSVVAGIEKGEHVATAVMYARDLVNEPPSVTTPIHLAQVATTLVKDKTNMTADIFDSSQIKKLGMGGLLGIARGSDEEPRFIKLSYHGGGRKTICLIGKGITFDTGGLSLKPAEGMETMKLDMAGAAVILGIFRVLPLLKLKVTVIGLIPATENMPGSKAVKPGDVVTAMNGKTIEILNTDAEGRVVLADALSYAVEKVKPDVIIDLATLTGACMVALGEEITGLFVNNTTLGTALKDSAQKSGEKVWELPLAREYKDLIKSKVADIKNISGKRYGGAINGALFLQEFVPDDIPWAHLDIAGPAFAQSDAPLTPHGGTGFGVRMLLHYFLSLS